VATAREARPVFERTPPQNILAERAVLGAMLINPEAVATAFEILREDPADLFYAGAHQFIFAAMTTLFTKRVKVDEVTVVEQLARDGKLEAAGGYSYIAELTGAAPLSSSVEYYATIVLDHAILRKLITTCTQIADEAFIHEGEVSDLLDHAEATVLRIAQYRQLTSVTQVGELVVETVRRIEELKKAGSHVTGLATGFYKLDELLSGLQKSDMIVLAARPTVGKTALALNIARHAAVHLQKSVLIFSLEMSKEQLMLRLFCTQGQLDFHKLRAGFLSGQEWGRIQEAADKLSRAKIFIDDTPNITVLDIRARARRHVQQHDLDLIILDYLQLMTGRRRAENRQVEIAEISRGIKGLARELNVPVMALSQLSREADRDESDVPKLSHLRESGAIEQDADVVLMLSRPPKEEEEKVDKGIVKVGVAKQRNGPTGTLELIFDRRHQRFENPAGVRTMKEAPPPSDETPFGPDDFDSPEYPASGVEENVGQGDDVPF
jgi:replicative DNA helicase